jgi:hypothetical protein
MCQVKIIYKNIYENNTTESFTTFAYDPKKYFKNIQKIDKHKCLTHQHLAAQDK